MPEIKLIDMRHPALSVSTDPAARYDAAENPATTPDVLTALGADPDIRRGVAAHANTPQEVLTQLARDPDRNVRMELLLVESRHHRERYRIYRALIAV